MNNTVSISGLIDFNAHARAIHAFVTHTRAGLLVYLLFVGSPLLALGGLAATHHDLSQPFVFGLPVWGASLLGPILMLAMVYLLCVVTVWQLRRRNVSLKDGMDFTVNLEGFMLRGRHSRVWIDWESVKRVVETREFFLFYTNESAVSVPFIPKTCANRTEELPAIRAIIRDVMEKNAKMS